MKISRAKAIERKNGTWYIICPSCKSRINLEECPIPGGMTYNIEFCYEYGAEIEVYSQPKKSKEKQ